MTDLLERIEIALERVRWRRQSVRSIYLSPAEHQQWLGKALSGDQRVRRIAASHVIKPGIRSVVYTRTGGAVVIPRRPSPRTGRPPAEEQAGLA